MKLTPIDATPIHSREVVAVVGGAFVRRQELSFAPSPLGRWLRALREELGCDEKSAARVLGIKHARLQQLESGAAELPPEQWPVAGDMLRDAARRDISYGR